MRNLQFAIKGSPMEIQMQLSSMLLKDAFDRVIKSTMDRNRALIKIMGAGQEIGKVIRDFNFYAQHGPVNTGKARIDMSPVVDKQWNKMKKHQGHSDWEYDKAVLAQEELESWKDHK